jgi:hypothetical protein
MIKLANVIEQWIHDQKINAMAVDYAIFGAIPVIVFDYGGGIMSFGAYIHQDEVIIPNLNGLPNTRVIANDPDFFNSLKSKLNLKYNQIRGFVL